MVLGYCITILLGVLVTLSKADNTGYGNPLDGYNQQELYYNYNYNQETEVEEKEKAPFGRADGYSIAMILILGAMLLHLIDPTVLTPLLSPITTPVGLILTALTSPITTPLNQLGAILATNPGRSMETDQGTFIPWDTLERLSMVVTSVVESDECLSRIVCQTGKFADGKTTFVKILDTVAPKHFSRQMKVFKESALGKFKCAKYKCTYFDANVM